MFRGAAAVSLWLNSGVPATEVTRRTGYGLAVLLKIYAHCIDGQAEAVNQRITDALGIHDAQPVPATKETTTASRHPEMSGQRQGSGRTVSMPLPPVPSVPVRAQHRP
jgi:hypothetical protein